MIISKINLIGSVFFDTIFTETSLNNFSVSYKVGGIYNCAKFLQMQDKSNFKVYATIGYDNHGESITREFLPKNLALYRTGGSTNKSSIMLRLDNSKEITTEVNHRKILSNFDCDERTWTHLSYLNTLDLSWRQLRKIRKSKVVSADTHGDYPNHYNKYIDILFSEEYYTSINKYKYIFIKKGYPNYNIIYNNNLTTSSKIDTTKKVQNCVGAGDYFAMDFMLKYISHDHIDLKEISDNISNILVKRQDTLFSYKW